MARAHHRSAYRYLATRHPAWWQAPLRWALKAGLGARVIYDLTVPVDHAQGEAARTEMVIAGVVYVPSEEAAF